MGLKLSAYADGRKRVARANLNIMPFLVIDMFTSLVFLEWAHALIYLLYKSAGHFRFESCNSNYSKVWNIDWPTKLANHSGSFLISSARICSRNRMYIHRMYSVYIALLRNMSISFSLPNREDIFIRVACIPMSCEKCGRTEGTATWSC